jgi:hypothetical protein
MLRLPRSIFVLTAASLLILPAGRVRGQATPQVPDSMRSRAARMAGALSGEDVANDPALADAINEILSDTSAHMRMAPHKMASTDDSARAADVASIARKALAKYKNVKRAEADGFVRFLPNVEPQSIYHYTNYEHAIAALFALDPARPTSLLYRRDKSGTLVLVGVMYTAPWTATPEDLDARLPLGIAHWHEHVNFCGPRRGAARQATPRAAAIELARWLRITSKEQCDAAGGRFTPRIFGWMAHAYVFAGTDPKTIWGDEGKGQMHMK